MAGHRCPVPGCEDPVTENQLLCRSHWFSVPREIRSRVWATYRQEAGTSAHLDACMDAVTAATEAAA